LVFLQESQKDPVIPIKVRANGLILVGIPMAISSLAPVLYESVVLNLDHLAPLIVGEPDSRHRETLQRLELESDPSGWVFRKLFDHRLRRTLFGFRERSPVFAPEEPKMRRLDQWQRLDCTDKTVSNNWWVVEIRRCYGRVAPQSAFSKPFPRNMFWC
jgi:hypothetical protein